MPQNPSAQTAEVRPTTKAVVKPVVAPLANGLVTLGPVVAYEISLATTALENVSTMAGKTPHLNLKKALIIVLEEMVQPFSFCFFLFKLYFPTNDQSFFV